MNREEFMRQLSSLLQDLSQEEREKALRYYEEYFEDAGPENEQNVIEALGNPARVAAGIRGGSRRFEIAPVEPRMNHTEETAQAGHGTAAPEDAVTVSHEEVSGQEVVSQPKQKMSPGTIVLIVLLCVLASPIALSVGAAAAAVIAGIITAWFGIIIGFGAAALTLFTLLVIFAAAGIAGLFSDPMVGMMLFGAGLICGGFGLLSLMLTVAMAGIATPAIFRATGRGIRILFGKKA